MLLSLTPRDATAGAGRPGAEHRYDSLPLVRLRWSDSWHAYDDRVTALPSRAGKRLVAPLQHLAIREHSEAELLSLPGGESCRACETDCGACPPTAPVCGDHKCEVSKGESCSACADDCGRCPAAPTFAFTGRRFDSTLKGMGSNGGDIGYFRARWVDTGAGRWLQPDPMGMVDGPNRYQYAASMPTQATDPSGWESKIYGFFGLFSLEFTEGCGVSGGLHGTANLAALDAMIEVVALAFNGEKGFVYYEDGLPKIFRYAHDIPLMFGPYFRFTPWAGQGGETVFENGWASTTISPELIIDPAFGADPYQRMMGTFTHEWIHFNWLQAAGLKSLANQSERLTRTRGVLAQAVTWKTTAGTDMRQTVGVATDDPVDSAAVRFVPEARSRLLFDSLSEHAGYVSEKIVGVRNRTYKRHVGTLY